MTPEPGPPKGSEVLLALDVDGVLLDPDRGGQGPWQAAFGARFGVDGAALDEAFFATAWADVIVGQRPIESALAEAFRRLGWGMEVEDALACWFEADFVINSAVADAAVAWSTTGCRVALVSNQEPRRARFLEARLGPLLAFDGTAFSGDLGVVKSDPGFYGRAERHLGLRDGAPVVFLDDTLRNVEAARSHGWTAIHLTARGEWRQELDSALRRCAGANGGA